MADNEKEQYVYNKEIKDRFIDLRKAVLKSNLDISSDDVTDDDSKDTLGDLAHWTLKFVKLILFMRSIHLSVERK